MTTTKSLTKALTFSTLILISSVAAAAAETFVVTNTNDTGSGSLRQAVLDANAATSADTIVFDPGIFSSPQTITLATAIAISPSANAIDTLTITGPGSHLLTVSGNNVTRHFSTITGDTTSISGMTLTKGGGGSGGGGGAIRNEGMTTLTNIVFTQNSFNGGGAILNGGTGTVVLNIHNCVFTGNTTTGTNINGDGGSAIESGNGLVTITDSIMTGGTTLGGGGGIRLSAATAVMNISNTTISNNTSGGVGNADGGGGIFNNGQLTLTNCVISGNTAGEGTDGGGIRNQGQLTLINTLVTGNTAQREGGGIQQDATNPGDFLQITGSTISNNIASTHTSGTGGGIHVQHNAELVISRSTISGNSVQTPQGQAPGEGGGIWANGEVIMDSCTVSGNSGAFFGGVRVPHNFHDSTITNSTIVNNAGAGVGMDPCPLSCMTLSIGNTIIANNSPDIRNATPDYHNNAINSLGYNLVENPEGSQASAPEGGEGFGGFVKPTDITGVDPNLGPRQNNGGPTETHAFQPGSPAIDKGKRLSELTTDQRGVTRPTDDPAIPNASGGDGSDIGAYEIGAFNGVAPKTLGNIATRLGVSTGENVLIGGFIVVGQVPKRVIIRAIGPSLGAAGVNGALDDPTLELFQGNTSLAFNNNWQDSQASEISATGVAPSDSREAAIVRTLDPGAYTAIVRGNANATGIGLVDGYDLEQRPDSKLGNIATRGFVSTGDNVLIGGFIVGPATRVAVRAIGPSLGAFGISGPLQDPTLELVDSQGSVVRANDNWKGIQRAELESIGIQPSDDRESALIATLTAGNYTAVVRGKDNTTGVAVVEVYNIE